MVRPVSMEQFEIYVAKKRRAIDTIISILWPRAKEIAREKISELPIAKDEHALNVKTDCALRARLAQYYGEKKPELAEVLQNELLNRHPYWDNAHRAVTTPIHYLRMIAKTNKDAELTLEEYKLLLDAAQEAIDEYLNAGNKLPSVLKEVSVF